MQLIHVVIILKVHQQLKSEFDETENIKKINYFSRLVRWRHFIIIKFN